MKTQYRIAEYEDNFTIEEWDEKLREWKEIQVESGYLGDKERTMVTLYFNYIQEAKDYIKNNLNKTQYPIYHDL